MYDAQPESGAAALTAPRLVNAVKAREDVRQVAIRYADAGVLHRQQHITAPAFDGDEHVAAGDVVLNGVLGQVEDYLINIILRRGDDAARLEFAVQRHLGLVRQR